MNVAHKLRLVYSFPCMYCKFWVFSFVQILQKVHQVLLLVNGLLDKYLKVVRLSSIVNQSLKLPKLEFIFWSPALWLQNTGEALTAHIDFYISYISTERKIKALP